MMKKLVLAAFAMGLTVSFAAMWQAPESVVQRPVKPETRKPEKPVKVVKPSEQDAQGEGMEDDAIERMKWDLKRLGDPATGKIPWNMRQRELAYAATLPSDRGVVRRGAPAWSNRGPVNVGGRTRAFGIDISNENRLLAGTVSGGIWLSTDAGASWKNTSVASQLKNATCLVQDKRPGHTNTWYYGSGEGYGASPSADGAYYLGDGLFKSTDGGLNWSSVASTAGGSVTQFSTNWQIVWNLAMDISAPDTAEEIYAACYSSIFRSADGGKNWTAVLSGGNSYANDVAVTSTGIVYATMNSDGTKKGIWRSTDGINFTNILPANFPVDYKRIVIGIDPNNENNVYFLAHTPGSGKATKDFQGKVEYNSFYKYTYLKGNGAGDTNGTWLNLTANLPATGGQFDKWYVQGAYDMVVSVMPGDSNTVIIGGTNLYRSTAAFTDSTHTTFIGGYEQFSKLPTINSYFNHHPDQHGVFFSPSNPKKMYSTNDGGLFRTNDITASPIVWESLNNGYVTSLFYTVAIDHATSGNEVIIGGAQDNGSWFTNTSDNTKPWIQPRGGDGSFCAIADNRSAYYFSIQNAKMMRTTLDANGNKTAFTRIDPIGLKGVQFINPYTLDPNNNNIMYLAGGKYLWRNSDLSGIPMTSGWDSITTNWTRWADSVPVANLKISAVTACKKPANRVYYGTETRKLYRVDNAHTGTPKPLDITSLTSGAVFPGANISCIAVDPRDGNKLMVVFSNYLSQSVFYSTDSGTHWSRQGGNLEPADNSGPSVRWASVIPVKDGTIYMLATSVGVFATTHLDTLKTVWVQQGSNTIGNAVCEMIDYRESDGLVVVATHANGMYSAKFTSVNDIVSVKDLANTKTPEINLFPNPANDQINLKIHTKISSDLLVEIWDNCGRIIDSKLIPDVSPGEKVYTHSIATLKPGIYYCSVRNGEYRKTVSFSVSR